MSDQAKDIALIMRALVLLFRSIPEPLVTELVIDFKDSLQRRAKELDNG